MACRTVQHTSNPVHVHELSWTIDHFSRTPLVLQGSPFSPISGCSEKFCLEIKFDESETNRFESTLRIHLLRLNYNEYNPINVSVGMTLQNTDDEVVKGKISKFIIDVQEENVIYDGYIDIPFKHKISTEWNLVNDKLVVKGTFSFSGLLVHSNISSNVTETSSTAREELIRDFRSMYESGFAWDVTFSVDGQTLHAHRAVICSRSPVFAKMFSIDMQEKNSYGVLIKDCNVHSFNCFLLYLYTSVVEDKEWDTVITLYSLASRYEVGSLRKECSRILADNMTIESVCSVLMLTDLHDDAELKEVEKKFLKENIFQVVGTTHWAEFLSTKPQLAKELMESIK